MANCPKCNRYLLWAICFNCKNSEPEKPIIKIDPPSSTTNHHNTISKKKPIKSKPVICSDTEPKTWLPLYSKSHLNHKLHYDFNSISKQSNCIELNGKYILHSDIIIWFKNHIS